MRLFAPALAFVDLETTGTRAADRRDHRDRHRPRRRRPRRRRGDPQSRSGARWSIPACRSRRRSRRSTGITNAMVRDAPTFARVADEVAARTAGRAVRRAQRALRLRLSQARVRPPRAHASRARVLCTVRLSRRLFPGGSRGTTSTASSRATRCRSTGATARSATRACCGRSCRRSTATSRRRRSRPRRSACCRTPSLPPQLAARRARRAARSAGRLPVLRPQRAAALHRQEHEPARARRRAFLVRLPLGDRPSALGGNPAHRVRGNRRRDRRAAARGRAGQVDAAGAQPRAAAQGRIRRARAAGRTGPAALCPRRRRRSRASSPAATDRFLRSGRRARRCATLAGRAPLCWTALGPGEAARARASRGR